MPPVNNILNLGRQYSTFARFAAALVMHNVLGLSNSAGGSRDAQGSDIAPSGVSTYHSDLFA